MRQLSFRIAVKSQQFPHGKKTVKQKKEKSTKSVAGNNPLLALWREASGKSGLLAGAKERSRRHNVSVQ